jgi:hypothetical protein
VRSSIQQNSGTTGVASLVRKTGADEQAQLKTCENVHSIG